MGSSFGLGNLWRFPYVVYENGGGAFVFLFFITLFVIGLPLIMAELAVGKMARTSSLMAFTKIDSNWFLRVLGPLPPLITVFVLSYYSVVSGWVLYFLGNFFIKSFFVNPMDWTQAYEVLQGSGHLQVGLTFLHLLVVTLIVGRGVEMGIERAVGLFMPVLIVLVFVLCGRSLSLDQAYNSLKLFLYPDFSKLHFSSFARVIGQVLFTLSLGFGIMITFGSYLKERVFIPMAAFRVVTLDALVSLCAGIMIFPIIGLTSLTYKGPDLLFETVPVWLGSFSGGSVFGIAFFLCLYLAALGSSIGLLETVVANIKEYKNLSRWRSALIAGGACLFFSILPALSSTQFRLISVQGRSLFETLDTLLIDVGLPVVALLLCLGIGPKLTLANFGSEMMETDSAPNRRVFFHWVWLIRWFIPAVLTVVLLLQAFDFLKKLAL